MGGRTQGCAERRFLHADTARICSSRARALNSALSHRSVTVHRWSNVQADAGDAPLRTFASGLLAVPTICTESRSQTKTSATSLVGSTISRGTADSREDSTGWAVRRLRHRYISCPTTCARLDRATSDFIAGDQRISDLCCLHLANALASETRGFLFSSRKSPAGLGDHPRARGFDCD